MSQTLRKTGGRRLKSDVSGEGRRGTKKEVKGRWTAASVIRRIRMTAKVIYLFAQEREKLDIASSPQAEVKIKDGGKKGGAHHFLILEGNGFRMSKRKERVRRYSERPWKGSDYVAIGQNVPL